MINSKIYLANVNLVRQVEKQPINGEKQSENPHGNVVFTNNINTAAMKQLEDTNEEFNNFMHKVTEVNNIVKKLASKDKCTQEIGTLEAERYLNDEKQVTYENICEDTVKLKIKTDRTVINEKALRKEEDPSGNTMSQEAFMEEVSKDAERRYQDKLVRKERAETFKTQATKAFRRGEYEKALTLYDKAIEQIKDSYMLYINRALTQINLQRYEQAIADVEKALLWNENSLKARLLLAKACFLNGNQAKFKKAVEDAKEKNEKQIQFIDDYVESLTSSNKVDQ